MFNDDFYDQLIAMAGTYPVGAQDDIIHDAAERVLMGMDPQNAFDAAVRHFNTRQRYLRYETSLDELIEASGDVEFFAIEPLSLTRKQRYSDHKASGKATPRVPERGIGELEQEELGFLLTVLRNLSDRGVVSGNALTFAIDVRGLPETLRRAVVSILCSYTRRELTEAGIDTWLRGRAEQWLEQYSNYAYRADQA